MMRMTSITLRILSGIPLLAGSAAFVWGIFCFSGGPDARPDHPAALIAGVVFWGVAVLCAGGYLLLNRKSAQARLTLIVAWTVPAGAASLLILTSAVCRGAWEAAVIPAVLLMSCGTAAAALLRRKRK